MWVTYVSSIRSPTTPLATWCIASPWHRYNGLNVGLTGGLPTGIPSAHDIIEWGIEFSLVCRIASLDGRIPSIMAFATITCASDTTLPAYDPSVRFNARPLCFNVSRNWNTAPRASTITWSSLTTVGYSLVKHFKFDILLFRIIIFFDDSVSSSSSTANPCDAGPWP